MNLSCERCGSNDTYFRKKDEKRVCRKCGMNSKIIQRDKPKTKPCYKCGSLCTYVRLDNTQICNKCGCVEKLK
jgi:transcription initiation factor TFIIIB Brf1 subunit/transcription initiation factor TFIIB